MSSYFVWDEKTLGLQIPSMDQEHEHLIAIMNNLFQKNEAKSAKNDTLTVINELLEFVQIHFKNEETYMEKIKFPGFINHRSIHQRLLAQLKQHKKDFEDNDSIEISDLFFDFLALWLTAHIQYFDREYSLWAKNSDQEGEIQS